MKIPKTVEGRVSALAALSYEHLSETPPLPTTVKVGWTRRCNLNCIFCNRGDPRGAFEGGPGGEVMSWENRLVILDKLEAVGTVDELGHFLWGEPFMDPLLVKTIEAARERGFEKNYITTNGTLLKPEVVEAAISAGATSIKISINWKDTDEFAKVAQRNPALFDRMLGYVRHAIAFRDQHFEVTGNWCDISASWIVLHRNSEQNMRPLLDKLEDWGVVTYPLTSYNIDEGQLTPEQIEEGWSVCIGNPGTFEHPHAPVPCHILFKFPVIDEYGMVHACCFDHGVNTPKFEVGSLLEEGVSFEDIWYRESYRKFRRAHLHSWRGKSMDPVCGTPCKGCLTPPKGVSGLLPGQTLFLDLDTPSGGQSAAAE